MRREAKRKMLKSVEGVYRDGKIELLETPDDAEGTRVIVTFLPGSVDLRARGIDEPQAADLRGRLKAFAVDWDRPEMDRPELDCCDEFVAPSRNRLDESRIISGITQRFAQSFDSRIEAGLKINKRVVLPKRGA